MKVTSRKARLSACAGLSAAAIAMLYGASRAAADTLTFDPLSSGSTGSIGDGTWDNSSTNWYSPTRGPVAFNSSAPDSAILGAYSINSGGTSVFNTITLGDNITVQNLTFNTSSNGGYYNIFDDFSGNQTLTLAGNITKAAGFGVPQFLLSNAIVLTAGNHVFAINDSPFDTSPELQFNAGGLNANLTGQGKVTINNGSFNQFGTVQFTADNTYTGGTDIIKGRLEILSGGGLGGMNGGLVTISSQGNLSLGGSGSGFTGGTTIATAIDITRNTYTGTDFSSYPEAITAVNKGGAKTITFSGPFMVDSTDARIGSYTNNIVISSNIQKGSSAATASLSLTGDLAGFVTLTGDNTALNGGINLLANVELTAYNQSNIGGPTSSLTFSGGSTFHPVAGFMTDFGTHVVNTTTFNGGIDIDPGQFFNVSGLSGVSIGKRGTGTLNLNGTNTFTGTPFYDAGIVNVNGATSFGGFRLRSPVVNVNSGATLTTTSAISAIGTDSPDNGTLNVLGTGKLVLANQDFNVSNGAGTQGTLNLSNSSVATNLGNSNFGRANNAVGTLNMNGSSSFVTNQTLGFGRNDAGATGIANIGGTATLAANGSTYIGYTGGTGTVTINGGTLNTNYTGGPSLDIGDANTSTSISKGTLLLNSGVVNVAGELWVGNGGSTNNGAGLALQVSSGTFQMSGGTVNASSWVAIGRFGAAGVFNMSGGTFNKSGSNNFYVGETNAFNTSVINLTGNATINDTVGEFWVANGGGSGVMNMSSTGSVTVNSWLAVGRNAGSVGILNINSGSVTQQGSNHLTIGSGGNGTVNVNGGSLTGLATYIGETGTGTFGILNISPGAAVTLNGVTTFGNAGSANGTLNLNGGTLTAAQFVKGASTGTQTFNFGGGTLVASASSTSYLSGLTAANVLQGGATINTSSFSINIAQPLLAGSGSTGGLTKQGTGTLTLSGSNTYAGATAVNVGTLISGNAKAIPGGTALSVGVGSGVNFNGFYPAAVNASSPTPALTLASLTTAANDTFTFNLSSGFADYIGIGGLATIGSNNVISLAYAQGTNLTPGDYTLLTATGGLGTFTLGNTLPFNTGGGQFTASLNHSTGVAEILTINRLAFLKLYFGGATNSSLSVAGNYTTDFAGASPSALTPDGTVDVVFNNQPASATLFTTTLDGLASVNSIEFNASAGVNITPGTSGTTPLSIVAGPNSYTTGTGIVVDAGAGASTISANLSFAQTESFINNSTTPLTIAGNVTGTAGLTLNGPFNVSGGMAITGPLSLTGSGGANISGVIGTSVGTVTYGNSGTVSVSGANTYTSGTNVTAGTVVLANTGALGSNANTLTATGGVVDANGLAVTQSSLNLSGGRVVDSKATGNLNLASTGVAIDITASYPQPRAVGDVTSALTLNGGAIIKPTNAGQPVFTGAINLAAPTVISMTDTGGDAAAELTLTGVISGGTTATLTINNAAVFTGTQAKATADDFGTLLLSNSNSYAGGTNIASGKIVVTNGNALGTGPVTIVQRSGGGGGTLAFGDSNYTSTSSPLAVGIIASGITVPNAINFGGQISGSYGYGIYNDSGNNTLSGPITLTSNATQSIFVNAGSLTLSNVIGESIAGAGLVKRGNGNMTLSNSSNTYTGLTQVNGGITFVPTLANGSSPSSIGMSTAAPANLVFNSGTIQYTGSNISIDRGYTVANGGTFNTGSANVTLRGQILSNAAGAFSKLGTGTLTYTNATGLNTFEGASNYGAFLVNQGIVAIGAPGVLASGQTNSFPGEVDIGGTSQVGYAEMDINGGTTNVGQYVTISRGNSIVGLSSTFSVGGDALLNSSNGAFGYNNGLPNYNASGTINITGTANWNDANVFRVAESTGSTITVNMNGTSALTVLGGASTGGLQVGYGGTGTFNQNGGTVVAINNPVQIGSNAAAAVGTYTLGNGSAGAVLRTGSVAGGSGTSAFVFNGGTLRANGSSATFVSGLTHAFVAAGPAVIDSNTYSVTIPQVIEHSASVPTDGGLTKVGAGTLTLAGANTYNGPTFVSAGTLATTGTTGSLGTGNVTVGTAVSGAVLTLSNGTSISDAATLNFYDNTTTVLSTINLNGANNTSETVLMLSNLATGQSYAVPGTYSAAFLNQQFGDSVFASSNGEMLTIVGAPEPASLMLLGMAAAPLVLGRRRRQLRSEKVPA